MREAILAAVRSTRLEDLQIAVELNEIPPLVGDDDQTDVLAAIRKHAVKPDATDMLAMLGRLLSTRWIALPLGPDLENNRVYVWPRFAETGLKDLSPGDESDLAALVPAEQLAMMRNGGLYTGWRIGIGADGTWHFLRR